jgi:hypothetical protein
MKWVAQKTTLTQTLLVARRGKLKVAGEELVSPLPAEFANDQLIFFINTKEDLLKEPNNKIFQAMSFKYPEIECSIENQSEISILIDSGAQISCVSQDLINKLIKKQCSI